MKILRVIASIDPKGGGPMEGLLHSSMEIQLHGHTVEIASCDAPDEPFLEGYPLPIQALGPPKSRYYYSAGLQRWLANHVQDYDCVIIHGLWQYHAFAARRACMKHNIPYFVFTHGMLDPWFRYHYPLKHLKKWLYWPWGDYRVLRDARAVLFTTEEERVLARQSFWLYKANEQVVGYGIKGASDGAEQQTQAFFAAVPEVKNKPFLLFLSRIHPKKGCDLLIEAFSEVSEQHPQWQLVMAGPDQTGWRQKLEALCQQKGIADKVHWTGMISGDIKWGAFRAADAFILPSHSENFGIVVAEALACGTPVLITDKVNIWREVKDEKAGLIEEDDLPGIMRLLAGFLNLPKDKKRAMNKKARICFEKNFEISKTVENLLNTIKGLL